MRVGLYLGDLRPDAGGGFTFQDEVLQAVIRALPGTSLEFVLLSSQAPTGFTPQISARLPHCRLPGERGQRLGRGCAMGYRDRASCCGLPACAAASTGSRGAPASISSGSSRRTSTKPICRTPLRCWDLQHRVQPWFPEVSSGGRWQYRELSYRTMLARAALVIACNGAAARELERFYGCPPQRTLLLPHPTPAFALAAAAQEKPALPSRLPVRDGFFFYPAQFWSHKNHIGLLRALAILRQRHGKSIPLILSGSDRGNVAHVRAEAGRLGITELVHFAGFVSRAELVALYRNALALVYPTYFGPENLPPLEAFALGCPVVASEVDGAREQLGDAALLADPRDFDALADAMNAVASNPELRQTLVARGLVRARQWTADDYARQALAAIEAFARVRASWP